MKAHERLEQWIKDSGLKKGFVADQIGVTPSQLSRLLAGGCEPGLATAVKIEGLAGIKPEDWVE